MARRPSSAVTTTDRILDAALKLFDRNGFEAVSIQDICRESGASVGSVYHHHGSRDGIIRALMDRGLGIYRASLLDAVKDARDAHAFVTAVVRHHLRFAVEQPAWARFIHRARKDASVTAREADMRAGTSRFLAELAAPIQRFVAEGSVRALPRELYVPLVMGPAQQLLQHHVEGRVKTDLLAAADVLAEAAWRAVAAPERAEKPDKARRRKR